MVPLDQLFNAQRRAWLICTVLSLTVVMSWSSIHRLQELVEAEDAHEPSDNVAQQSLFSLAEKNVLEHLPQRRAGGLTAMYCWACPTPRHTAGGVLHPGAAWTSAACHRHCCATLLAVFSCRAT